MARTKEGEVARGLTREDSSSIMIQSWIFFCSVVGGWREHIQIYIYKGIARATIWGQTFCGQEKRPQKFCPDPGKRERFFLHEGSCGGGEQKLNSGYILNMECQIYRF